MKQHASDRHCTNVVNGECQDCHVVGGDPCGFCGGERFHRKGCIESDDCSHTIRFWVYWRGANVRIALKPMESVTMHSFANTEEGWESVVATYSRFDRVIEREIVRDGRDCDGRLTVYDKDETTVEKIVAASGCGPDEMYEAKEVLPRWTRVSASQRDETAEGMGY